MKTKYYKKRRRPRIIGIYLIKNLKTDKIYIGSSKDCAMRWNSHLFNLITNSHCNKDLQEDFNSTGISNFSFILLHTEDIKSITSYFLKLKEQNYIDFYKQQGYLLYNLKRACSKK